MLNTYASSTTVIVRLDFFLQMAAGVMHSSSVGERSGTFDPSLSGGRTTALAKGRFSTASLDKKAFSRASMNEANNRLVENDSVQLNDNMVNDADRPPIIFTIEDSPPPKTEVLQAENFFQIDGNIRPWLFKIAKLTVCREAKHEVFCLCYTETHEFLAAGLANGTLTFYKAITGENVLSLYDAEIMQNPAPITAVKHRPVRPAHPIMHTILATYANGCVKCWHYPTKQCIYTIREKRQTLGIAYHPHLPKFVTVGDDSILHLYDEETKTRERVFHGSELVDVMDGHKSRVFCACFHPKSMHELISGGWDDTIQFWDVRQAHSVRYISGVHICGDSLDISRNGKEILACSWKKEDSLQLYSYDSGKLITKLEPDIYSSSLYSGKYVTNMFIACGGCDINLFRIIDLRSHSTVAMIKYLKSGVYNLDIGVLLPKLRFPRLAFCAGTTILEVDFRPD
ncbi:hypothetical protein HN011_012192 [Eciton burchellii]|nr:hypothetical protein HN011_012192 [Eciton burchellii]